MSDEVEFCLYQGAFSSGPNSWLKREMEKPTKALMLSKPVSNPLLSVYGQDGKSRDASDEPRFDDPIEVEFAEVEPLDPYCNNNNQMLPDDSMADWFTTCYTNGINSSFIYTDYPCWQNSLQDWKHDQRYGSKYGRGFCYLTKWNHSCYSVLWTTFTF